MKIKLFNKKAVVVFSSLAIVTILGACGKNDPVEVPKDSKQKVEDTSMTKKIEKENIVSGSKVYIQDKMIIATMLINKDAKEEDVQVVANQYAQELKAKYNNLQGEYKGMSINVQAVQDGKNVANILIEK